MMSPDRQAALMHQMFEYLSQSPYWAKDLAIVCTPDIYARTKAYECYFLFLMDLWEVLQEESVTFDDAAYDCLTEELSQLYDIGAPIFIHKNLHFEKDRLQQEVLSLRKAYQIPEKTFMNVPLLSADDIEDNASVITFGSVTTLSTLAYSDLSRSCSPFEYDEDLNYDTPSTGRSERFEDDVITPKYDSTF